MKERPILFSAPMVRAILEGKKTQTRRVCKAARDHGGVWADEACLAQDGLPIFWWNLVGGPITGRAEFTRKMYPEGNPCPYGQPGDRLWVRETWFKNMAGEILYRADYGPESYEGGAKGWKPSIHMPRAYSRISLEVTAVRVERLQSITTAAACAEGIPGCRPDMPNVHAIAAYVALWNAINGKRYPWEINPWVWVIQFTRITTTTTAPPSLPPR